MNEYRIINIKDKWYVQTRPNKWYKFLLEWKRISKYIGENGKHYLLSGELIYGQSSFSEAESLMNSYKYYLQSKKEGKEYEIIYGPFR